MKIGAGLAPGPSLKLGAGESEAITVAHECHADVILLDDRKARVQAQQRGLKVVGTLAVLATAARRGLLDLPTAIERLQQTTFRGPVELMQLIVEENRD